MVRIVTDYLDNSALTFPDKVAFSDDRREITFKQLREEALHLATALISLGIKKKPVLIYLDKSVEVIAAFNGVAYSGNFYSPLDTHMPQERIGKIVDRLQPIAVITDESHIDDVQKILPGIAVITYEDRKSVV